MTTEQRKALVREFILEVWGNPAGGERMREVISPRFVDHQPWGDVSQGLDEQVRQHANFHAAFDITIDLKHVICEGDLVCDHWVGELTHKGEFLGIPATGRTVAVTAIDLHRIEDGTIAESWHMEDFPQRLAELREAAEAASQP